MLYLVFEKNKLAQGFTTLHQSAFMTTDIFDFLLFLHTKQKEMVNTCFAGLASILTIPN